MPGCPEHHASARLSHQYSRLQRRHEISRSPHTCRQYIRLSDTVFFQSLKGQLHEQDGVEMLDTKEGSSSSQLHLRRIDQKTFLIAFLLVLCTYIMCKRQLNTTEELNFSLTVCLLSLSKQSPQKPACKSITLVGRITEEVVGETMMANDSGVWQSLNKRE